MIEEKKRISQEQLVWIMMVVIVPCLRLGTAGEDEGELQHAHKVAMMSNRQDNQP